MNDNNEHIKSLLTQTYRPPPQSSQEREIFHRQVRRRVKRSVMLRVATASVLASALALFVWQSSSAPSSIMPPSIGQTEVAQSLIVEASPNPIWSDVLVDAWSAIDDLATYELSELEDTDDHYIGIDLPESMMVIARIVDLTDGKDMYP